MNLNAMKLELKHLAPYLPYETKFSCEKTEDEFVVGLLIGLDAMENVAVIFSDEFIGATSLGIAPCHLDKIKPILRPLSDLTKEIEHNGEKFVPSTIFPEHGPYDTAFKIQNRLPYSVVAILFEWHFDVFGLIDEGLAIDINTLE